MQVRDSHDGNLIQAVSVLVPVETASQKICACNALMLEGWCRHLCAYAELSVSKCEISR